MVELNVSQSAMVSVDFSSIYFIAFVILFQGALTAVFALANIFATPFSGPIIDKFGRRFTMTIGIFLQIIAVLVFVLRSLFCFITCLFGLRMLFTGRFSNDYWALMIARFFQGCSSAVAWTAGLVLLGDVFPENEQGSANGLVMTFAGT
jgi:DHA1 family solute carrier family 18 vesicular amine transporter 1/2